MKKNFFIPMLAACAVLSMFSCNEDTYKNESLESEKTIMSTDTSYYIVDSVSCQVITVTYSDNTVETLNELAPELEEVLNESTSTLLVDPFNKNTFFAFKTVELSKVKNSEIIAHLNELEGLADESITLKSSAGRVYLFDNSNYNDALDPAYIIFDASNYKGGDSSLTDNDQLSSYYIQSDNRGARSDGKRIVVTFWESEDFSGRSLTGYCTFTDDDSGLSDNDGDVCWEDQDMANTLRKGGISKLYWGDCVSSISYDLEE